MRGFAYRAASSAEMARDAATAGASFIGGGTTLLDLMKLDVMRPETLVDVTGIAGHDEVTLEPGVLRIGAMTRMSDLAGHAEVKRLYPVVAETLALAASQQLRQMARLGGNVLQRTRCAYFRDPSHGACNKRVPGSGCAALDGNSRAHAILGTSSDCIAAYPGDWAQALIALDAEVEIFGKSGKRVETFAALHRRPGTTPHIETSLAPDDLITAFVISGGPWPRSRYVKVRDRDSYEFGLATAAVALRMDGDVVREARMALGGVATVPWRASAAEASLRGRALNEMTASEAAEAAFMTAETTGDNAYKLPLGKATLIRALLEAGSMDVEEMPV